jgi:hypothetical protein
MSKLESRGTDRAPLQIRGIAFFPPPGLERLQDDAMNRARDGTDRATEFSDRPGDRACVEKDRSVQAGQRFAIFQTDRFRTSRV